jgi:myo-inositol 2-dehydrogenase/D-chiro-inositol 1-dehydrogenase
MSRQQSSRRDFFKGVAAATGVAMAVPYFVSRSFARQESANDKLNVGSIGTSIYTDRYTGAGEHAGRGAVIGHQAGAIGNMIAVADVNLRHARFFAKEYDSKIEIYQDYRKLLDRKDIDVVTIGTPDHWHVKVAIDALRAGKHVYCEKPLTLTVDEGKKVCQVAKETGLVLQVGTQQRSEFDEVFLKAVVLARSGRLGDNLHALSSVGTGDKGGPFENSEPPTDLDWDFWLGQAPKVPYCKHRCDYDFRWWLEYSGGQVTDWGVHHTDIACWALGLDSTGPYEIEGKGTYPKIANGYNIAVDFDCTMKFAGNKTIRLFSGENELIISGSRGRIRVNRERLTGKPVEELTEKDNDWLREEILKLCHGKKPGNHMRNFFDCVKDGGMPISDVWSHHRSVSACHLANIAMLLGRKLKFDPVKENFLGDEEATAMLSRLQRPEYAL